MTALEYYQGQYKNPLISPLLWNNEAQDYTPVQTPSLVEAIPCIESQEHSVVIQCRDSICLIKEWESSEDMARGLPCLQTLITVNTLQQGPQLYWLLRESQMLPFESFSGEGTMFATSEDSISKVQGGQTAEKCHLQHQKMIQKSTVEVLVIPDSFPRRSNWRAH